MVSILGSMALAVRFVPPVAALLATSRMQCGRFLGYTLQFSLVSGFIKWMLEKPKMDLVMIGLPGSGKTVSTSPGTSTHLHTSAASWESSSSSEDTSCGSMHYLERVVFSYRWTNRIPSQSKLSSLCQTLTLTLPSIRRPCWSGPVVT